MLLDILENGHLVDRARWYPSWLAKVELGTASVSLCHDPAAHTVTLTCHDGLAIGVTVDADAMLDEGFVDLCAGESVTWHYRPLADFDGVTPYAYNARFTVSEK